MTFRGGRHVVAAALSLLAAGCQMPRPAEIDPYAAQPVVTTAKGKAPPPGPDVAEKTGRAEAALQSAESAWRSGDALTALAVASQALIDGVPSAYDAPLRDLRARARAAVVATKICRVRVIPEKDVVADGTPVALRIEFANLSNASLTVPRAKEGSSDAVVVLKLVREDFDVFGNQRSTDYTLNVPVREDLTLAPGARRETRLTVPAEMTRLAHEGFSVLSLEGAFRPVVLRAGESELYDSIPIEKASLRIFMKGFEPLADDPLGSLKKALAKRSPPHVLAAAELLAPTDRAEARAALLAAREADPDLAAVAEAALARLPLGN